MSKANRRTKCGSQRISISTSSVKLGALKKLGRISEWMRIPSSPLSFGKRSQESSSEVSVPVISQPKEVAQPTEAKQTIEMAS